MKQNRKNVAFPFETLFFKRGISESKEPQAPLIRCYKNINGMSQNKDSIYLKNELEKDLQCLNVTMEKMTIFM